MLVSHAAMGQRDATRPGSEWGVLMASCDAVALDTVASDLSGHDFESDPVLSAAAEAGLGIGHPEGIRVRLVSGQARMPKAGRPAGDSSMRRRLSEAALGLASTALTARLRVDRARCSACGVCVNNCHINGLAEAGDSPGPIWRESLCVHCWTCVENCPEGALEIRYGLFSGGARRLWRKICDV